MAGRKGVPLPDVSDLGALLAEVRQLPDVLEASWSGALPEGKLDPSGELKARWSALIGALTREILTLEEARASKGLPIEFGTFPLVAASFSEARVVELEHLIAATIAYSSLLGSMNGLNEPLRHQFDSRHGRRSWWDSGAFARVAGLGAAAVRLARLVGAVDRDAAQVRSIQPIAEWLELVGMARRSFDCGLIEGAVTYCSMALRALASAPERTSEASAKDPADVLASLDVTRHLAEPARQLIALEGNIDSDPRGTFKAWNLASFWVAELRIELYRNVSNNGGVVGKRGGAPDET